MKNFSPRGFTLIEIIVSVGLFSVVMLVASSAYLSIITLDKEGRATNELVANLHFTIESMVRNIRTGVSYSCAGAGNGTCSQFSFTDAIGQPTTYLLKDDGTTKTIAQCVSGVCTTATAVPLTDSRVTITGLTFNVRGVGGGDGTQPQVLMSITGTMPSANGRTVNFTIQTTAAQRFLEL